MDPITLALIGASLAGGAIQSFGAKRANDTNRQIAEMQNRLNYQMFQEQNKFNLDLWNKTNAYNTPTEQVKRLDEAGINPMMALGAINPGNTTSLTSASPAQAVGYQAQNELEGVGNSVQNTVDTYLRQRLQKTQESNIASSTSKTQAETAGILENNKYIGDRTKSEIAKTQADIAKTNSERESIEVKRQLEVTQLQEQINSLRVSNEYQKLQSDIAKWTRDVYNPRQAELLATQMADVNAAIQLKGAQMQLTKTQAWNVYEQTYKAIAEKEGIQLNNGYLKKIQPILMQGLKFDNDGKLINNEYMSGKAGRENLGLFISLLGTMNRN